MAMTFLTNEDELRFQHRLVGNGAPTTETVAAIGEQYMDVDTGATYKCTSVDNGVYTWQINSNNGVVSSGVGETVNGGEIFNDYNHNIIENNDNYNTYAHAEGCQTVAGWRSHAEGYNNIANNTSHAEGRLSRATGKGSHAEGHGSNIDLVDENKNLIITSRSFSIDDKEVYVDYDLVSTEIVKVGDSVSFRPIEEITEEDPNYFIMTDDKRVENIEYLEDSQETKITLNACLRDANYFEGWNCNADGVVPAGAKVALSVYNIASSDGSHAEGIGSQAINRGAHAEGRHTIAEGNWSHSEGNNTVASGEASHVEGQDSNAIAWTSHAEGYKTEASGDSAHAEGNTTLAQGVASHAEGNRTIASGHYSHAEGSYDLKDTGCIIGKRGVSTEDTSFYLCDFLTLDEGDKIALRASDNSVTTSIRTVTYYKDFMGSDYNPDLAGVVAYCEVDMPFDKDVDIGAKILKACYSTASGNSSHVEGVGSEASGGISHAEGYFTKASGNHSHAENRQTIASGLRSHAEGYATEATNEDAHAEGHKTIASGYRSHAEGYYTIAKGNNQHVQGRYNKENSSYAHIVGNGTSEANRKNAHTLDWNGNAWFKGDIKIGGTDYDDEAASVVATRGYVNNAVANVDGGVGQKTAQGGEIFNSATSAGNKAHAEGDATQASGDFSHAEGQATESSGRRSHAEGWKTKATAQRAHAEGYATNASGEDSHAEGNTTVASGLRAHAEGSNTIAACNDQHVQGKYNIEDTSGKYAHIVGNGSTETARSNAHTLDWSGNAWYAGDILNDGNIDTKGNVRINGDIYLHNGGRIYCDGPWGVDLVWTEDEKIPSHYLPSYVDDIIEGYYVDGRFGESDSGTPEIPGESGKIYIDLNTNKSYRWSGSQYVEISSSLALGETASTAYYGDKGKIAYDHSKAVGNPHGTTAADLNVYEKEYIDNKFDTIVGVKSENGGEIFNDYKNNIIEAYDGLDNTYAHAEGSYTTAGWRSHAEGYMTIANNTSHAEGRLTQATGQGSHAEGVDVSVDLADQDGNFIATNKAICIDSNIVTVAGDITDILHVGDVMSLRSISSEELPWSEMTATDNKKIVDISLDYDFGPGESGGGDESEGGEGNFDYYSLKSSSNTDDPWADYLVTTITLNSPFRADNYYEGNGCPVSDGTIDGVAEGVGYIPAGAKLTKTGFNVASGRGAHAEGAVTTASGYAAHAEGLYTQATSEGSHAEGSYNIASGLRTHAEGYYTEATSDNAHAEGRKTQAIGKHSHAEGNETIAEGTSSHAEGEVNTASGYCAHVEGKNNTSSGNYSHAEGHQTNSTGFYAHAEGYKTIADGESGHAEGCGTEASATYSHSEGWRTKAKSKYQHVQGKWNVEDSAEKYAHIVGNGASGAPSNAHTLDWKGNAWYSGNIKIGGTDYNDTNAKEIATKDDINTAISGISSVGQKTSEGGEIFNGATSAGKNAHAEGWLTNATGQNSHAEGDTTTASGAHSHAEGYLCEASGEQAHAEGNRTVASGNQSHAEGVRTTAASYCQHVHGRNNISDSESKYLTIIGNSRDNANPSNAHTLDWNGNAWYSGTVSCGVTSVSGDTDLVPKAQLDAKISELKTLISESISGAIGGSY